MRRLWERAILAVARLPLPRGGREWMAGDLEEQYSTLRAERGAAAAVRWIVAESARNVRDRLTTFTWERRAMHTIGRDLRYALRLMRLSPTFTAVIVVTLALGIGANTAIFSVVDALLFKALPYPGAERLYTVVLASDQPEGMASWPYPKYEAFAREQQEFDLTAAYARTMPTIDAGGQPMRVEAEIVSSGYFSLFDARPALGRLFSDDENRVPGRDAVVVLSDALWRGAFAADPAVVGRTVTLKERPYTIVGVMSPGFRGQTGTSEIWLPVMMAEHFMYKGAATESSSWWVRPVGRLRAGISLDEATSRMPALSERVGRIDASRLARAMRDGRELFQLRPFRDTKIDPAVSRSFLVLLAAVGFVLVIACANTANLLLGRAVRRQGEFAVRLALGASRADVRRQVIVESLVLSVIAGAAALLVARGVLAWLTTAKPMNVTGFWSQYGRTFDFFDVSLDPRVAAVNFAVALGVGVLFAMLPARRAARMELNDALKLRTAGAHLGVRGLLVLAEIAFSVVLLASAGLMVRSFANAANARLGFEPAQIVTMSVAMQKRKTFAFYHEVVERLRALPGVDSAALATGAPLGGGLSSGPVTIEGRPAKDAAVRSGINVVTPAYFSSLRMKVLSGRTFTDEDLAGAPRVAVISQRFAREAWPGQEALGKRFRHAFRVAFGSADDWTTVVGVVDDAVYDTLEDPMMPVFYLPAAQPLGTPAAMSMAPDTIVVRTSSPAPVIAGVRQVLQRMDPASPVHDVLSLDERVRKATSRYRYSSAMMGALAALALALAAIGTYGVIAYSVATRTREIGIRMALGARPGELMRMLLGSGMKLTAAGLAIGLAGALAAARTMTSMLFGVTPHDPWTFAAIAAVIASVAGLATYVPARRAMRIEPTRALRQE
jgi:predicted permease